MYLAALLGTTIERFPLQADESHWVAHEGDLEPAMERIREGIVARHHNLLLDLSSRHLLPTDEIEAIQPTIEFSIHRRD
jgi:hypothetical protein